MADDILSPMLLVPDFKQLFVICLMDEAFSKAGTWESQKQDIKQILEKGNDEFSHHREVYAYYNKIIPITKLDESCTILEETDSNNRWMLAFMYKGVRRELIYFHHTDYYLFKWPSEINNISHLMSMGAVFMTDKGGRVQNEYKEFFKFLEERTNTDCIYYDQYGMWDYEHNLYDYKKDYTTVNVRNQKIIINKFKYELNRS